MATDNQNIKNVDFVQLRKLVKETLLEIDGGIMDPNMVPAVPFRQPAADAPTKREYTKEDELYDIAYAAREATERLVEALDEPVYDGVYEDAFKATTCLGRALNGLRAAGANPPPDKVVVAPTAPEQKYFGMDGYEAPTYSGTDLE